MKLANQVRESGKNLLSFPVPKACFSVRDQSSRERTNMAAMSVVVYFGLFTVDSAQSCIQKFIKFQRESIMLLRKPF